MKRPAAAAAGLGILLIAGHPAAAVAPSIQTPIPEDAFKPVVVRSVRRFTEPMPPTSPPPGRPQPVLPTPEAIIIVIAPPVLPPPPPVRAHTPTVADAKAYALAVLGPVQYACLDQIAIHESHWTTPDINPTSGAYGLFQALPGSKMAVAGADWRTNPVTQTRWAIDFYIPSRYGTACNAWAFWEGHRWW